MNPGWRLRRLATGNQLLGRRLWRSIAPLDERGEIRLTATCIRCATAAWAGNWALSTLHHHPSWTAAATGLWAIGAWRAQPLPRASTTTPKMDATCNDGGAERGSEGDLAGGGEGMWIMNDDPDDDRRTTIEWKKTRT